MPRPRRIVPPRQWRIDSDEPLPPGRQALDQPFSAFPSWLMKVTCDRCGQERIFAEAHAARQRDMLIRDILAKMRHDGCGGPAGKVELLTGIEGVSSRPVRRIALITNPMLQPASIRRR